MRSRSRIIASLIILTSVTFNLACNHTQNTVKAKFEEQVKLANAGNADAQNWVSVQYADGSDYLHADQRQSLIWAEKAANAGNAAAQYGLAVRYQNGTAVEPNINTTVAWYKRCAENGTGRWQSEALNALALLTFNGTETGETNAGAYEWIARSAMQGNQYACFFMGMHHQRVGYTEEDQRIAKAFFEWSAERRFPQAQFLLGILYFNGKFIRHDNEKAFAWVQKAAQQNYPEAQYLLSVFYDKGVGTGVNKDQSIEWHQKAEILATSKGNEIDHKVASLLLRSRNPNAK